VPDADLTVPVILVTRATGIPETCYIGNTQRPKIPGRRDAEAGQQGGHEGKYEVLHGGQRVRAVSVGAVHFFRRHDAEGDGFEAVFRAYAGAKGLEALVYRNDQ